MQNEWAVLFAIFGTIIATFAMLGVFIYVLNKAFDYWD